ncbi:hypothetical protein [Spirosoma montaniterrae]|nr:hypothetical protein [Spirosoma montaniterrae]
MKQPRVIQRFSSLMLATLLLFTAVWGAGGMVQQRAELTKKAAVEHGKTGKSAESHSQDAQLSAAGFEAVVTPATCVGGGHQTAFLLPEPTFVLLLLLSVALLRHFQFPHYFFSYFRHVFGTTIAPNAP